LAERGAKARAPLLILPGAEQPQHLEADRARERVPAERRAVLPGTEDAEDVAPGDDRRQGPDPAAERLAEDVDVGDDVLVLARERRAGASEAGLDLVGDQQDVPL